MTTSIVFGKSSSEGGIFLKPLTTAEFEKRMPYILEAPQTSGILKRIVIRPQSNERVILKSCLLTVAGGATGDGWANGCWKSLPDGSPHPDVQLAMINERVMQTISPEEANRALAGDNLYVDFDLSERNLAPGDRLAIGKALIEITSTPHTGCGKFKGRFGADALAYINSAYGKQCRLRGIYAKVIAEGIVSVGDEVKKV